MKPLVFLACVMLFHKVQCRDSSCCTRMANETIKSLTVFKECLMEKAERFFSMNERDCPPACMVVMFSEQCIEEANATTADPVEILLSTTFDKELNFSTITGGDCPMPSVIEMLTENQYHVRKWFQIFCTCMECKYYKRTGSDAPSEIEVIRFIQDCYQKSQAICPQQILPDNTAFSMAILREAKRNVPCCWNKFATALTTRGPCDEHLDSLCRRLVNGTYNFFDQYLSCVSSKEANLSLIGGTPSTDTVHSPCMAQANTSVNSIFQYHYKLWGHMESKWSRTDLSSDSWVDIHGNHTREIQNIINIFLGKFCDCMSEDVTHFLATAGTCPNRTQMVTHTVDCYIETDTSLNGRRSILLKVGGFTKIYGAFLVDQTDFYWTD